ncbi:MAG: hypothetical protein WCE30_21445 [Mycobacterium sp.]
MLLSATLGSLLSGVSVPGHLRHPARLVTAGPQPLTRNLPGVEIVCSAASLDAPELARWVVRHRQSVSAVGGSELDAALAAGVQPASIGVHCDDLTDNQIRWAASIGVGRLVVSSRHQADLVSSVRERGPLNVWLQSGTGFAVVRGRPSLRLAGLDARYDGRDYAALVDDLMAELAEIRRESGVIVGHLGISGVHTDSDAVWAIDDAVTDGCIRYRVPRPQLLLCGGLLIA